jgi:hypothetical protein
MTRSVRALDRSRRAFIVAPFAIAVAGVGVLVARALASKLHARLVAGCERMFERMPDTFPPKRMMRGIDEIRATSASTLALLEAREQAKEAETPAEEAAPHTARPEWGGPRRRVGAGMSEHDARDGEGRDRERRTTHSAR